MQQYPPQGYAVDANGNPIQQPQYIQQQQPQYIQQQPMYVQQQQPQYVQQQQPQQVYVQPQYINASPEQVQPTVMYTPASPPVPVNAPITSMSTESSSDSAVGSHGDEEKLCLSVIYTHTHHTRMLSTLVPILALHVHESDCIFCFLFCFVCSCITPERLTDEKRKKKMRLHVPCAVIGGISSLVLLILAIVALVKISNFTAAFTDILDTWNAQPIYDINFVTISPTTGFGVCASGYTFKSGTWKGTSPACTCFGTAAVNSTDTTSCAGTSKGQTVDSSCSSNNNVAASGKCCDRTAIPSQPLSLASNLGLCVYRAGADALQRPSLSDVKTGTCPTGTIRCGVGAKNWYCITPPSTFPGKCPITDLAIASVDITESNFPVLEKRSLGIIDGVTQYLYISRGDMVPSSVQPLNIRSPLSQNVTTYPLTDLWIDTGRPCLIESSCWASGRTTEYLNQQSNAKANNPFKGYSLVSGTNPCKGCTKPPKVDGGNVAPNGEDIRYVQVYSRPEGKAFNESGVPKDFQALASSGFSFAIQARSEVSWSNECSKTRKDIDGQENNVKYVRNFQIVLLIISIFTFIVFSVAIPVAEYKTQGRWGETRGNWYLKTFLNVGFKLFVIAFTLATMFVALAVLAYWVEVDGSKPSSSCSDPLSTEVFKILSTDYRSLSYSNVGSVVTMGFTGAMDGVGKILWMCGK
jgi:hypothetical protein